MIEPVRRAAWAALLALFAVVLVRTAWLSDDAFLSFRCADNLVHGYGLRWNVAERVQVFSNPLWTFAIAALLAVTREIWATALIFSSLLSMAAVVLLGMFSGWSWAGLVGALALVVSRAFTDYSTSGLENPLLHLLLVAFAFALRRSDVAPRRPFVIAALLATTRDDALLLALPALVQTSWGCPKRDVIRDAAIGLAPYWIWKSFALVYFGFPAPNTAYAKLAAGVPWTAFIPQGMHYFANSLRWDPITLLAVAAGLAAARRGRAGGLAAGVVLYLVYVVRVGGDFMSGRFLAAPLVLAVWIAVAAVPALRARTALALMAALVVYGVFFARSPLRTGKNYRQTILHENLTDAHGITDERAHYHQFSNPLCRRDGERMPSYKGVDWGLEQRARGVAGVQRVLVVGMRGYYAGPGMHLLEGFGLEDPLMARLPMAPGTEWRIGHFPRPIPAGYIETLATHQNRIADPAIARLYDDIALVTRGPIWSARRFAAMVRLNRHRVQRR